MELGTVTGYRKDKNKDGDIDRILLSVQILDEDVRTVEYIPQFGEDTIPENGSRVAVFTLSDSYQIALNVSDDLESEVAQGEKEIYAVSGGEKKARIKCGIDEVVTINQGMNHAAQYEALKTAFEELQDKFNNHVHPGVTAGGASTSATATPSTGDITAAEVEDVKLP